MRVLIVLPRNMRFGEAGATSIDLTVRDLVEHRPDGVDCTVATAHAGKAFPGHDIVRIAETSTREKVRDIVAHLCSTTYDVIVVQQHLPTAAKLAAKTSIPVVLHTHNFQKSMPALSFLRRLRRAFRLGRYKTLSGLIHVSEVCRDDFRMHWPEVKAPQAVVYNGLDMRAWEANEAREASIVCVARNVPEKGVLEAAEATRAVLELRDGWRARFILSETRSDCGYAQRALQVLNEDARVEVLLDQPHQVVKQAYQTAAIALVPSVWREPFGRTALEAHAGGCAVVTSGTGGLKEVSGEHAVLLPEVTMSALKSGILTLIDDEPFRRRLAADGRAHVVAAFDIDRVARDFFEFCRTVALAPKSAPRR